ncbi:MAG TPA: S8 family serine peptidase [Bradyrhizobium sp.]|jgi:subtilisin|nr:S8 family serine peptidase [Bradyrhizobium sp.]
MADKKQTLRRYILIGTDAPTGAPFAAATFNASAEMVAVKPRPQAVSAPEMRVLAELHGGASKLVEMSAEGELSLRISDPGLKIVPEVIYHRQWQRFRVHSRPPKTKAQAARTKAAKAAKGKKSKAKAAGTRVSAAATAVAAAAFSITVTRASDGTPVAGCNVVAFTNFAARVGANGTTAASGRASMSGLSPGQHLERVYIYPPAGVWGFFASDTTGSQVSNVKLPDIDVKDPKLLLTQLYGSLPINAGDGITVGIIDSGIDATHPDLPNVTGGLNCVSAEVIADPAAKVNFGPALIEGEHGTHVAGIIGGRGTTSGFRGVAPGVKMRSYRVFPNEAASDGSHGASNFDIVQAIDTAVADGCDIINMSLGGSGRDDVTDAAIDRAIAAGVVVVVAAGNANRAPVYFPAAYPPCVAVAAMGRIGSFPKTSIGTSDIATPRGVPGSQDFVADFSNIGPEIDITGPGVAIVSTLPGTSHGAMNGTSMACPAVTGFVAFLLSSDPGLKQKTGAERSRAVKDALYAACKPQGFGRNFEGFGLPLPTAQV